MCTRVIFLQQTHTLEHAASCLLRVRLRARHALMHRLFHFIRPRLRHAITLGPRRVGHRATRVHPLGVLVQVVSLLADKRAPGHLTIVPDDVDVVSVGLVLFEIASRLRLVLTARLSTHVPTHVDTVKLSLVLAHVVDTLALVVAWRAVWIELGARVPHQVDAMHVSLVAIQQRTVGSDIVAASARKLPLDLGGARLERRYGLRDVAVWKVLRDELEIVKRRDTIV